VVSCDPNLVLPIELINFKGETFQLDAIVSWTTASELNNDYFILQRSFDARNWENIEIIPGYGNSAEIHHYKIIDEKPGKAVVYYQLQQYDFDGSIQNQGIVAVSFQEESWIIYPNPSSEKWNLSMLESNSSPQIEVYDLQGNKMAIRTNKNQNLIEISLVNHVPGIYFLSVFDKNGTRLYDSKILAQ